LPHSVAAQAVSFVYDNSPPTLAKAISVATILNLP